MNVLFRKSLHLVLHFFPLLYHSRFLQAVSSTLFTLILTSFSNPHRFISDCESQSSPQFSGGSATSIKFVLSFLAFIILSSALSNLSVSLNFLIAADGC